MDKRRSSWVHVLSCKGQVYLQTVVAFDVNEAYDRCIALAKLDGITNGISMYLGKGRLGPDELDNITGIEEEADNDQT